MICRFARLFLKRFKERVFDQNQVFNPFFRIKGFERHIYAPEKANDISFFAHAATKTRNDDGGRRPAGAVVVNVVEPVRVALKAVQRKPLEIKLVGVHDRLLAGALAGPAAGKLLIRRHVEPLAEVRILPSVMDVRLADLLISCVV